MRHFLMILMVILSLSCSKDKIPKGILKEKQITPVLVEIHLAEAIFAQRYSQQTTLENYQENLYLSILKKYKIDQKVFEKSVLYYGKHPDKYKLVYDEVLNRLSEMSAESRVKDSIQAKKIKSRPGTGEGVKINNVKVKPGNADSLKINKIKVPPVNKDTVQSLQ